MFVIEPMVGKTLLPYLGGSPNVWNVCVLFFQICLLIGYSYAHLLTTHLKKQLQLIVHMVLLWLPALTLPLSVHFNSPQVENPIPWLISTLITFIGPVFLALSTTTPLLQKWYASNSFFRHQDPYFLFAASNLGSLIGLLLYPFCFEPSFSLSQQRQYVSQLYIVFAAFITVCGAFANSKSIQNFESKHNSSDLSEVQSQLTSRPETRDYWHWLLLTIVPASLFLGLTSFITQELASFPLFWIGPLAIYLVSFIITFGGLPAKIVQLCRVLTLPMVAISLMLILSEAVHIGMQEGFLGVTNGISVHFITLLLVCVACHGRVAIERPNPDFLTNYYLVISIGGILGTSFNSLIAPVIFNDKLEYPLMLSVAFITLLPYRPLIKWKRYSTKAAWIVTPAMVLIACILGCGFFPTTVESASEFLRAMLQEMSLELLIPLCVAFICAQTHAQARLGMACLAAFWLWSHTASAPSVLVKSRDFFGCKKITIDRERKIYSLWNGRQIHGAQNLDPKLWHVPRTYYMPESGVGVAMRMLFSNAQVEDQQPFGVIGLGVGSLVSYAKPGQVAVFYELDPEVIRIANDSNYFTFLANARKRKADVRIEAGDGRLNLAKAPDDFFRLIVIDAFNSDSIPTHLLTLEAMDLYIKKLKKDGALAFHISNYYFDLKPLLQELARERGMQAWWLHNTSSNAYDSDWVIVTADQRLCEQLKKFRFRQLNAESSIRAWTDDYSNPLSIIKPDRIN